MQAWRMAWFAIVGAFFASLGLAVRIVATFGTERGFTMALAATARLAFPVFGLGFAVWGRLFAPEGARARFWPCFRGRDDCSPWTGCMAVHKRDGAAEDHIRHLRRRRCLHLPSCAFSQAARPQDCSLSYQCGRQADQSVDGFVSTARRRNLSKVRPLCRDQRASGSGTESTPISRILSRGRTSCRGCLRMGCNALFGAAGLLQRRTWRALPRSGAGRP
jgi:hypothetical protein